jgi:hypothetical protein
MAQAGGVSYRDGIPFDQIVTLMRQRRSQDSILIRQMIDIRDRYNGDVVIPSPDVNDAPTIDPPTPRLITQAIDGTAMTAASSRPVIECPIADLASDRSRKKSEIRRRMLYGTWFESQLDIKMYRSYRHLAGYGTCSWVVMPDPDREVASIELRDPLTSYPELRAPDDVRDPLNVGYIYGRSADWIQRAYPEKAANFLANAAGRNWDTLWDMVEWIDEDEIVVGVLGPRMPAYSPQDSRPYGYGGFELARWKNRAGRVTAVCPRRVTLDRIMGQISAMIGTVDLFTRMSALQVLANEKYVFPDLVVMGRDPSVPPELVGGSWRDGRTGEANLVNNAADVKYLETGASPAVEQSLQRLEESIREVGGANPMMAGQNAGMRTGRGLATLGSFSVDPRSQEIQIIQSYALTEVNRIAIAVTKGYFGGKQFSMFTGLSGDSSQVDFVPNKDLDSDLNAVKYPIPGADVNQMSVAVSQLVGSKLVSRRTGMILHPLVEDPDEEQKLIAIQDMTDSISASAQQQMSTGAMPLVDAARTLELLEQGKSWAQALTTAHNEAQKRQAAQAPPPGPGEAASPAAMPGLSPPGAGAESQPPPAIPQSPPSLANFRQLTQQLKANPSPQALVGSGSGSPAA